MSLIQREVFNWGVRLTVRPFAGHKALGGMVIFAEISLPRPNRGSTVKIMFSAALAAASLGLPDAQAWQNAMSALLIEARSIVVEMKTAAKKEPKKKTKRKK